MTYLWMPALPIIVTLKEGRLVQFQWAGRVHRVLWIMREWRVDVEWWRLRIWRDYCKLVTETGLLMVVYCDLMSGGWFLQQMYD